jgi:hypothetical protein
MLQYRGRWGVDAWANDAPRRAPTPGRPRADVCHLGDGTPLLRDCTAAACASAVHSGYAKDRASGGKRQLRRLRDEERMRALTVRADTYSKLPQVW